MKITGAVLETSGAEPPFAESRPLTVGVLELDAPGPGEILVRIEVAGICHSDLSVIDGNRLRPLALRSLLPGRRRSQRNLLPTRSGR